MELKEAIGVVSNVIQQHCKNKGIEAWAIICKYLEDIEKSAAKDQCKENTTMR